MKVFGYHQYRYGMRRLQVALRRKEALRSQSRRGDYYDNAQDKSPWSRLKTEVLALRERPIFADLADAQASVANYFDYYNQERLHASIAIRLINKFFNLTP